MCAVFDPAGDITAPPTCWECGRGPRSSEEEAEVIVGHAPSLVFMVVAHKGKDFVMVALQDERVATTGADGRRATLDGRNEPAAA